MSELRSVPTHILLKQLQSMDITQCNCILEALIYRFGGPFVRYATTELGTADAPAVTNYTMWKIYKYRGNYEKQECACTGECLCAERAAHRYIWTIHRNTVSACKQEAYLSNLLEMLDETYLAPEDCRSSPEAYVENRIKQEILLRVWGSLSESDQQALKYRSGPGRRNLELEQIRERLKQEALERFRMALKAALAEEE